jgi:hypothetical protein
MMSDGEYCERLLKQSAESFFQVYPEIYLIVQSFWCPPLHPDQRRMMRRFHHPHLCEQIGGQCGVIGQVDDLDFDVCGFHLTYLLGDVRLCIHCRAPLGEKYRRVLSDGYGARLGRSAFSDSVGADSPAPVDWQISPARRQSFQGRANVRR